MSDEMHDVEQKLEENIRKSTDVDDLNLMSVASVSNEGALPQIFKLDIDCFEELFEWLSLKDLLVLRQLCKRFKRLADYYIKLFYPAFKLGHGRVNIGSYSNIDYYRCLDPNLAKLIKNISFWVDRLSEEHIQDLKAILSEIEVLKMLQCQVNGDFYESFLQYCPNLKHLIISEIKNSEIMGKHNEWLHREYPKLEFVEFDDSDIGGDGNASVIPELKIFFTLNPNIHTFSTTFHLLLENSRWMIGSSVQFDALEVKGNCYLAQSMDRVCGLLSTLHEQGFYKRLHFHGNYIYTEDWNRIATLPSVELIYLTTVWNPIVLPPSMSCVKELGFQFSRDCKDPERLANNLMNIERVFFERSASTDILPFIRIAPRLKAICVLHLVEGTYFENGVIDVAAMNRERENLNNACKQTIFVEESIFLTTKWAGMPTQRSLIQLKRIEASFPNHTKKVKEFSLRQFVANL